MTRRIYLAGPYSSRATLVKYAAEAEQIGYSLTARWLDGTHEVVEDETKATDEDRARWAREDLAGIDKAAVLVAFTAAASGCPPFAGTSGGRHVELGYAIARGKRVILVGERENVFHSLPSVARCPDWHDALILLAAELVMHERGTHRAVDGAA